MKKYIYSIVSLQLAGLLVFFFYGTAYAYKANAYSYDAQISPTFFNLVPCPTCDSPIDVPGQATSSPNSGASSTVPEVSTSQTNPTVAPCSTDASIASDNKRKKSKHKIHKGAISEFMNAIIKFLLELINKLIALLGGKEINVPETAPTPSGVISAPSGVIPNPNPCDQPQPSAAVEVPGEVIPTQPGSTNPAPSAGAIVPVPTGTTADSCTNPIWTSKGTNDMIENGGYFVHNNAWGDNPGPQTTFVCAFNNWYVTSTQTNSAGAVKTYPNVHKDFNNLNGDPWSKYKTITSTFAGKGPGIGIYDVAYDLWLNGVGFGNGHTEVMIWTENLGQRPLGSVKAQMTSGGITYDVWHYNSGGANVVSFVAKQTMLSGNLNLKEMIDWAIGQGMIPANPTVNQIGYGIEFVSTDGKPGIFKVTNFSVTAN